jgi:hypothetical protein
MKLHFVLSAFLATSLFSFNLAAQPGKSDKQPSKNMYIDVHHLGAGKATAKDLGVFKMTNPLVIVQ